MQAYYIIGLMSGTSLDGIDLCYAQFYNNGTESYALLHGKTIEYTSEFQKQLRKANQCSALELMQLDTDLGIFFGEQIKLFIKENNIQQIDAIASHGHTIFHSPQHHLSTQIGSPAQIYAITGIKTIADFRSIDVALGGQGAPLVPIGDQQLFSNYSSCLNLGGIANISFDQQQKRIAYDICMCNMALNYLALKLGHSYDKNGNIASSGQINLKLLEDLNQFHYFSSEPPKSLGREQFDDWYLPLLENSSISVPDMMATTVEHIGMQIGKNIPKGNCLLTGGGVFNTSLINALKKHTQSTLEIPNNNLIEYKEALVFAYLGMLRLTNRKNTLSSVTGARRDSIGGCLYG